MKHNLRVMLFSTALVLLVSFAMLNFNPSLTGFAISEADNNSIGGNITREQVLFEISESYKIINEMQELNFSTVYMNDTLIEAQRVLKQADYAEMLRTNSGDYMQRVEAKKALALIDWKNLDYSEVLKYTDNVKLRKKQGLEIYDTITITGLSLARYGDSGINILDAENLVSEAKIAFYADRYTEAEEFLKQARIVIDTQGSENSMLKDLRASLLGFLEGYWIYLLLIILLLSIVIYYSHRKIIIYSFNRKINRMKVEQGVLNDLMKNAQTERFKNNKISALVYNIRMKSYKEKLERINEELPVLDSRLKQYLKTPKTSNLYGKQKS